MSFEADLMARRRRLRVGIFMLAFGVVLIVWAWASWLYRYSAESRPPAGATRIIPRGGDQAVPLGALAVWLALGFALFLIVLLSSYALARAKRRHFANQRDARQTATQSEDLWSRHRLTGRDLND